MKKSLSYEGFLELASEELLSKFFDDVSKYSDGGMSTDDYFYSNSTYWESQLTTNVLSEDGNELFFDRDFNLIWERTQTQNILGGEDFTNDVWSKGNIITDWLEQNNNPEIDNQVEKEAEILNAAKRYAEEESGESWNDSRNEGYLNSYVQPFIAGAEFQKERMFTYEDMIKAARYGYNFHKTTQFAWQEFEDSWINNFKQWLTTFKTKRDE